MRSEDDMPAQRADSGRHDFQVVDSRTVYSGAILALRLDQVIMPGGHTVDREVVEHHGAVAIVAVDADDRLVLIDQYRHPIQRRLLELPAGLLDQPGEDALAAAQRELAEETGLAAAHWSVLVDVALSPGFTDEALRIYLATELWQTARPEPRYEEADLQVVRMGLAEAVDGALAGRIVNATAVAGVMALWALRTREVTPRAADADWPGMPRALLARKHGGQE